MSLASQPSKQRRVGSPPTRPEGSFTVAGAVNSATIASLTGGEDFPGQLLRQRTITGNHSGFGISRS